MWPKLKKQLRQWRGVLIVAPTMAAFVIAAGSTGLFQLLEWATLDRFFRMRPLETPDSRIVVVTIDEQDINSIGQWPIPDGILAEAIENLKLHQPRAIGVDLYRDLPTKGHEKLINLFQETPYLFVVEKEVGEAVAAPPEIKKLNQVSLADLVLDEDGKVRRALLTIRNDQGVTKQGLGLTLALTYLKAENITPKKINKDQLGLGKAVFTALTKNDGGYINADVGGYQILLNYRGTENNFYTIPMRDVLKNRISPDLVRDRIVFIGVTSNSINDLFFTPYSSHLSKNAKRVPGVIVHANITSQIINAAIAGRPLITFWPESAEWLWVLIWSFIGASQTWALFKGNLFRQKAYLRWIIQIICLVITGVIPIVSSYGLFLLGIWIPVLPAISGFFVSAIALAGYYTRSLQRETEKRLSQFLEAIPVAIAVLDENGKPCYANNAAQELLGKGVLPDINPDQISEVYQNYIAGTNQIYPVENLPIIRALKGEYSTANDIEIHQGDKIIPIEAWGTPIYDENGNINYALVAFKDITDRKKSEEERANFIDEMFKLNCDLELALEAELALTEAYGRFVPHEFLHFLGYESIIEAKLGDNIQIEMSILFADIRNFTTISEIMTPEDNFKFINAYLSRMEPAINEHNGFIDKYIGDAIMALFGSSVDDALQAAIEMLQRLTEYNITRGRPGRPVIDIGIGINTGLLMLGTVGSETRMNNTVISDAVNLASRIEGLTKSYGVSLLISHHTFCRLEDANKYCIRLIDRVKVKGKSEKVIVYEVFDADHKEIRAKKLATKTMFEKGIILYNQTNFSEAGELFQKCLEINPQDKVAKIYLNRCNSMGCEISTEPMIEDTF